MSRRNKLADDRKQWIIGMYNQGTSVRKICDAAGITPPTFYRYLRDHEDEVNIRKPGAWNDTGEPLPYKSAAASRAWEKRSTPEAKAARRLKETAPKDINALDVLSRLKLALGKDNLGDYIHRGDDGKKIYLTSGEFSMLIKKPLECLKVLAPRINSGLKDDDGV